MSTQLIPKSALVTRMKWIAETAAVLQRKPVLEAREQVWLAWAQPRYRELYTNLTLGIYGPERTA